MNISPGVKIFNVTGSMAGADVLFGASLYHTTNINDSFTAPSSNPKYLMVDSYQRGGTGSMAGSILIECTSLKFIVLQGALYSSNTLTDENKIVAPGPLSLNTYYYFKMSQTASTSGCFFQITNSACTSFKNSSGYLYGTEGVIYYFYK